MRTILATDIHGVHEAMRSMFAPLAPVTLVSPWQGETMPFETEREAVSAFHQRDGLSDYGGKIAQAVAGEPALLIGFSVGATCLWRFVAGADCHPDSIAVLYYGSRIRAWPDLVPRCQTKLVFAEWETAFDPFPLSESLARRGVSSTVLAGTHHGFMSPASPHFRPDIFDQELKQIEACLTVRYKT